jgi:1,2-diacylglycerol 3-beta-glucosyltransferase
VSINLTITSYVILAIVLYYGVLFCVSLLQRQRDPTEGGPYGLFVIVVPARNEEAVLGDTIANLVGLSYAGDWRVLVMDDASTDRTEEIAAEWLLASERVRVISRTAAEGGKGKGDVLNHAYQTILGWLEDGDGFLAGVPPESIIFGIVDADGRLEQHCLDRVSPYFLDPRVGTTQIAVQIANSRQSLLARMQDMEFVAFSWLVQIARDRIGSSGLGGNGQFTRLSALLSLGETPWSPLALTEDLDLGLQLVERGWRTRFCPTTYVAQQGLQSWKPLLRQRTRWIQGHYQCWAHLPRLLRSRGVPLRTRIDLTIYLLLVVTVVLVTANLAIGILGMFGILRVTNTFLFGIVPPGVAYRLLSLVISVLPLTIFVLSYQLHSRSRFRWFEVPSAAVVFTLYTYVWFYATLRAWTRIAMRRTSWVKTPRVLGDGAVGGVQPVGGGRV